MIQPARARADGITELHRTVSYWCLNDHHTTRSWSGAADVPTTWECGHCGLPAGRDNARPPQPVRARPFKSPLAHLMKRRSEAECEALLDEALANLRARRHRGGRRRS